MCIDHITLCLLGTRSTSELKGLLLAYEPKFRLGGRRNSAKIRPSVELNGQRARARALNGLLGHCMLSLSHSPNDWGLANEALAIRV